MKILSLDQCFLRSLTGNTGDPRFANLKTIILNAIDTEKMLCPAHVDETVFESSLLPKDVMGQIFEFQNRISHGFAFLPFTQLLGDETLALVRPTHSFLPHKIQPLGPFPGRDRLAQSIRKTKNDYNVRIAAVPYPPKAHSPTDKLKEIYNSVLLERCRSMLRVAKRLRTTNSLPDISSVWDCANIVGRFLREHGVTDIELVNLIEKIQKREWERIPVLFFDTIVYARIEEDILNVGRQLDANDTVDIARLSVALNCADVIGCDGPMKEIVKQIKLDQGSAVFSIREPDALRECIERLPG
jgi:hypothetical protein